MSEGFELQPLHAPIVTPQAPKEVNQESPGVLEVGGRDWSSLQASPELEQSQFSRVFLVASTRVLPVWSSYAALREI